MGANRQQQQQQQIKTLDNQNDEIWGIPQFKSQNQEEALEQRSNQKRKLFLHAGEDRFAGCRSLNENDDYGDYSFAIESVEKELDEAKNKVEELKNRIRTLKQQQQRSVMRMMTTTPQRSNNDNKPCLLQGQTLKMMLKYLCPKDVLSCARACRQWNYDINYNEDWKLPIWKIAAENRSRTFVETMIERLRESFGEKASSQLFV